MPNLEHQGSQCPSKQHVDKIIGYYESWAFDKRKCDTLPPESLPLDVYSHINFAFATIDPQTFKVVLPEGNSSSNLLQRLISVKSAYRGLEIWIAIGGWAFSEPDAPTFRTFSDLVASEKHQDTFFKSLNQLIDDYHLDGVDIDWEYPGNPERGGRPEDYSNLVVFLGRLKAALRRRGGDKGLSMAIPAGLDSLQYFNIREIAQHVDWLNVMSYDLHGAWEVPAGTAERVLIGQNQPGIGLVEHSKSEKAAPSTPNSGRKIEYATVQSDPQAARNVRIISKAGSYSTVAATVPLRTADITEPKPTGAAVDSYLNTATSAWYATTEIQVNSRSNITSITQPNVSLPPVNSHTNLTELVNTIDLLLRQGISPKKLVLGLAFYGRSFTLANSNCISPGCPVNAVGISGRCGDDPGILYNAEIREKIRVKHLTPTLDTTAAVELLNWDDEWITFDSERSFSIKSSFARSRGINGFMVWAASHDDHNGTDSRALGRGLGLCV